MRILAVLFALLAGLVISGCSLLPDQQGDETAGWSDTKLYSEAREAMSDGIWDKAIKLFEKLEARYPYGRYAQQAQLEVAYAYYKQTEAASAISACDRFIRLHPNHPNVDYAYYLKGLVNFNDDQGLIGYISMQDMTERDPKAAKESFATFKELVTKFPDSKYAADAALRMEFLVSTLAAGEVHTARYYFNRGAFVAAANRAQATLKSYPNTPATEEALYLMMTSYDRLGLTALRDDARRIMTKNFPNSTFLTYGYNLPTPWWKVW
jgi:outer membrane protein assembly factor BamD